MKIEITREEGDIVVTAVQARRLQLIDLNHMKEANRHEKLFYKLIKQVVEYDRKKRGKKE